MDIQQAIRDFLIDDATLNDAVRNDARLELRELVGDKVYDAVRPQDVGPYAITISGARGSVLSGLAGPIDVGTPVLDVTVWCSRAEPIKALERGRIYRAIRALFHQFRGSLNEDMAVQTMHLEAEPFDTTAPPRDGSDKWTHRRTFPFLVVHDIAAPARAAAAAVAPVEPSEDLSTEGDIILPSETAWTPDADATAIADGNALDGHAWQVGENDSQSEIITAFAVAEARTYKALVRYRTAGTGIVGSAILRFQQTGESDQTIAIASVDKTTTYDGTETYDGSSGYYDTGNVTLVAGDVTALIEGPTTASDSIIVDRVVLVAQ